MLDKMEREVAKSIKIETLPRNLNMLSGTHCSCSDQ